MKRDMDLVRSILIAIEKNEKAIVRRKDLDLTLQQMFPDGLPWSNEQLIEHTRLMQQADLVGANVAPIGPRGFFLIRLTWAGHEFLANARDENVWQKAKSKFGDAGFDVIKQVLLEGAKQAILGQ